MDLVVVENDGQWEELLSAQPGRSLYHTSEWLKFQARHFGMELHRLVVRDGSRPVGIFPVFVSRRAIFRVAASPRGVDYLYLGPLVAPEHLGGLLDGYERWVRANRIDLSSVAFMSEVDADVARRHGYKCQQHLTALTDLRGGQDAVMGRCTPECRKRVRKAERMGVTVAEGDLAPHIDRYLDWSARVYAKSGSKSPLTRAVLTDMLDTLGRAGRLLSLVAEADGEVIGMYVVGRFGKTGYSLDIVTDYDKLQYPASNLLTWRAMQWCCEHGIDTFDFGGARIASIARFKKSFGANILPYSNIVKAHGLLARSAAWLKESALPKIKGLRSGRRRCAPRGGGGSPPHDPKPL